MTMISIKPSVMEAIINSTHNLIISVDITGRVKIFNTSAEKFFGKKFEDVYVVNNIRDATHLFELQSELDQMKGLTELYKNQLQQHKDVLLI
jgi:nitrogen fixation/metabolism regulation signal transduction histidine kinase